MPRIRNAKTVAKRIDLQYFAKLSPFRRWVLILSVALPLLAAGWILGKERLHEQAAYSSGPISSAHAVFGQQCEMCHVRGASFSAPVKDETCLPATMHRLQRPPDVHTEVQCMYVEHKGSLRLAMTADSGCTQCHGNLMVRDGAPNYDPHISGFGSPPS